MLEFTPMSSEFSTKPFEGSEQAKNCEFCAILEGVNENRIGIAGSESATAFMSKKDGHPLIVPLTHVDGRD